MAVIAHRFARAIIWLVVLSLPVFGDRAADIRAQLSHIATALSDGNASDAMAPFSKSFANYDKLRNYFDGLTNAYQLANEVDVIDEDDKENESLLTVNWSLTITDPATDSSEHRASQIAVRFVRDGKKWKIADFSPIEVFNPQQK